MGRKTGKKPIKYTSSVAKITDGIITVEISWIKKLFITLTNYVFAFLTFSWPITKKFDADNLIGTNLPANPNLISKELHLKTMKERYVTNLELVISP